MKLYIKFLFLLLLNVGVLFGQDSSRVSELGSTIVTVNSFQRKYYYPQSRPSIEILNTLFYRHHFKSYAFRAMLSYTQNKIDYAPPPGTFDGSSGSVENTNLMFGIGLQSRLKKSKELLYASGDICYRNTFSKGNSMNDGIKNTYSNSSDGVDAYVGLGFNFNVHKYLRICPELCYNINFSRTHTLNNFGQGAVPGTTYNFNISSILKIQFTAAF
jgi:hypothetical protein